MTEKLTAVTGANGWLGLNLVEKLRDSGRVPGVRALVLAGTPLDRLEKISEDIDIRTVDITLPETLEGTFEGVESVFHCAGVIHANPGTLMKINAQGTKNVLGAAVSQGVKRFVHISSNSVMGFNESAEKLFTEDMPCKPYKKYGKSKHLAELAVNEAQEKGEIETVILRPCWYYGRYQPERQNTFFEMIKSGKPIMFGDGNNLRSITCLPNLVDAMLLAEASPKAAGRTYWIANEKPYSMNEVYETLAKVLEVAELKPRRLPNLASALCRLADGAFQLLGLYHSKIHVGGEMNKHIACSIEKAKNELGYDPKVTLEECVRSSLEWCRENGFDI